MQKKTLLLVDSDGDCEEAVAVAAAQIGCRVQWVKTAQDIFHSFCHRLHDFALVVIDVDPGSHGMALLEAISACGDRPPMIVLTSLETVYMASIAREHGAAACLGKPIMRDELAKTLSDVLTKECLTCDYWGHLTPPHIDEGRNVKDAVRGIAEKLSPIKASNRSGKGRQMSAGKAVADPLCQKK
jgi:DNA-binding NtrC family response regulator